MARLLEKINIEWKLKFKIDPRNKIVSEKNRLKKSGIRINPKGINILKFSSNVKELVIQWILPKKNPNPNTVPRTNRFFL